MATLLSVVQRVCRHFAQQDAAVAMLPVPLSATSTAGDALGILDTKLARATTSDANHFDKRFVEIVENVGSGPAVGEIAVVADGGFDLTSDLTIAPAFSAAVESGADYILYPRGLTPTVVQQAINDTLRQTHGPHLWFPSLVNDAEFENNDQANDWPEVSGSSLTTVQFTTTNIREQLFGERHLDLAADAAGEGVRSVIFNVHENMTLIVSVITHVQVGTFDVVLYDETNSQAIKEVVVSDRHFSEVRFQEQPPADCERATIRFIANANADHARISPPVIVQAAGWHYYVAPSWLTNPESQLIEAREFALPQSSSESDIYLALTQQPERGPATSFYRSDNYFTPNWIMIDPRGQRPVFFTVKRPYDELSALTSTTPCDEDYLTYSAIARIYRDRAAAESDTSKALLLDRNANKFGARAAAVARAKKYGREQQSEEVPLTVV